MCGSLGTGWPSWWTVTPSAYRAPASSRPDTNWLDADASIVTDPPRSPPVPWTMNGSVPRPSSSIRRTEVAQGVEHRPHRPHPGLRRRRRSDLAVGQDRDRRQEPHHGAGQAGVDLGRPVQPGRGDQPVGAEPVVRRTCVVAVRAADRGRPGPSAERGQRVGHQQGVPRAQRAAQPGRARRERGEHEIAVGEGLAARQGDRGVDRSGATRCRPVGGAHPGHCQPSTAGAWPHGR